MRPSPRRPRRPLSIRRRPAHKRRILRPRPRTNINIPLPFHLHLHTALLLLLFFFLFLLFLFILLLTSMVIFMLLMLLNRRRRLARHHPKNSSIITPSMPLRRHLPRRYGSHRHIDVHNPKTRLIIRNSCRHSSMPASQWPKNAYTPSINIHKNKKKKKNHNTKKKKKKPLTPPPQNVASHNLVINSHPPIPAVDA